MADPKKKGLGKGLGALISFNPDVENRGVAPIIEDAASGQERLIHIDPKTIEPNPTQPRKTFHEEALEELAASIKRDGVQEPVIVRKVGEKYQLVSGERRVRASVMADLEKVPAICRQISDGEMLKLGLIENIQREDLNPIELAEAYQALIDQFHWTQEQLADEVGKNRATVTNMLRLLNLPEDVQAYVRDGALSMGHARALLAIPQPSLQRKAARKVVEQGLSVRETEKLAAPPPPKAATVPERKDANVVELEDELRRRFGTKVRIQNGKNQTGRIEIEYFNFDELDRILHLLRGGK